MGLSGVVGLADWVLVVECVRRAGGLRKVGLKRGVAVGMGELQRGKCVLVVRVGRQLGSGA
jgi:urocanate hydratase